MLPGTASAYTIEQTADSLTVVFRFVPDKDMFFSPYDDNGAELQRLADFVQRHRAQITSGSMPLRVDGYCNSATTERQGLSIARTRSNRVKSELIVRHGLTEDCFLTRNHATQGDFVTVSVSLPSGPHVDALMAELQKDADGGGQPGEATTTAPVAKADPVPAAPAEEQQPQTHTAATAEPHTDTTAEPYTASTTKPHTTGIPLSLRANLLRWATLTPDLGIEWRINPSWSIQVNGTWTSWSWSDKDRRYALWEVSPELRRYMGSKHRGYLGLMYHVGSFNYKLGDTDRQGDLMGGGLTGGYLLRLSGAFSLDFSIGLGYTHADYEKYVVTDAVRVWQSDCTKNYWGINHLGVSLLWQFK